LVEERWRGVELYHFTELLSICGEVPTAAQHFFRMQEPGQARAVSYIQGAKAQGRMEGDMSDPHYTDPRYGDSQMSAPVGRRSGSTDGTWGWVAGIVVIALIAIFLIAGSKGVSNNTASNAPPAGAPATASIPRGPTPSTTGMASPSPSAAQKPTITPTNPPSKSGGTQ
jgi:hypothetical protein